LVEEVSPDTNPGGLQSSAVARAAGHPAADV